MKTWGSLQEQLIALGVAVPETHATQKGSRRRRANAIASSSPDLPVAPKPPSKKKSGKKRKQTTPKHSGKVRKPAANGVVCILCGQRVEHGKMFHHKKDAHGEQMFTESPIQPRRAHNWVSIVSGGLPGLGKRSR